MTLYVQMPTARNAREEEEEEEGDLAQFVTLLCLNTKARSLSGLLAGGREGGRGEMNMGDPFPMSDPPSDAMSVAVT